MSIMFYSLKIVITAFFYQKSHSAKKPFAQQGLVLPFVLLAAVVVGSISLGGYHVVKRVRAQVATDTTSPVISVPQFSDFYLLVNGVVTIEPTITDESPIAKVQLAFHDPQNPINGGLSPEYTFTDTEAPFQFPWDTTKMRDGRQRFNVKAWDIYGNGDNTSLGASLMAMNDPNYPAIQVITPTPGSTVSGPVPIEVSTSAAKGIVGVYIDGILPGGGWMSLAGPPYRWTWYTGDVQDGPHRFRVRSFEQDPFRPGDLGDPGEISFDVIVKNGVSSTPTPTPTTTPAKTGIIMGTIFNKDSQPIQGAKISLTINKQKKTYTSDAQGKYLIPNVPPGTYTVTYVAAGYSQQKTTATITAGQTLVIDVTLNRR